MHNVHMYVSVAHFDFFVFSSRTSATANWRGHATGDFLSSRQARPLDPGDLRTDVCPDDSSYIGYCHTRRTDEAFNHRRHQTVELHDSPPPTTPLL
jgi:hypothetical protein